MQQLPNSDGSYYYDYQNAPQYQQQQQQQEYNTYGQTGWVTDPASQPDPQQGSGYGMPVGYAGQQVVPFNNLHQGAGPSSLAAVVEEVAGPDTYPSDDTTSVSHSCSDGSNDINNEVAIPGSVTVNPVVAATLRQRFEESKRRLGGIGSPHHLDPLSLALLWRQQQQHDDDRDENRGGSGSCSGRPRTPLSPHTLCRCLAAVAAGQPFTLTPECALAPSPLALTWHSNEDGNEEAAVGPPPPSSSTVAAAAMARVRDASQRHLKRPLRDDEEGEAETEVQPWQRARMEQELQFRLLPGERSPVSGSRKRGRGG